MRDIVDIDIPKSKLTAEIIYSTAGVESKIDQIRVLADNCSEPNPFYDSEVLNAGLRYLLLDTKYVFVFIYAQPTEKSVEPSMGLVGFFPFLIPKGGIYKFIPTIRSFSHKYCFVHTPLLDKNNFNSVLDAFLYLFKSKKLPFLFLEFKKQRVAGNFLPQLISRAKQNRFLLIPRRYETTPILMSGSDMVLSKKRVKRLRQLSNKFSREYNISVQMDTKDYSIDAIMKNYLDLEHSGWKGKEGSSFASHPGDLKFFNRIISYLHKTKKLSVDYLTADGQTVAVYFTFCSSEAHNVCYGFKTTYDEKFKKFSPGILLLYYKSKEFLESNAEGYIDSCAPNNKMVDELWKDRDDFLTVAIGSRTLLAQVIYYLYKLSDGLERGFARLFTIPKKRVWSSARSQHRDRARFFFK